MRRLIAIAATVLAVVVLPTIAGAGVDRSVETWTNEPTFWFGPDPCTGKVATGRGVESGMASIVETSNGGSHVRIEARGTVDLYEANGPGPSDPRPGAFVGTWTYEAKTSDQAPPDGQGAVTGVASGPIVFADGSSANRKILFHLTWEKNGPPKLFFAKFVCAGD